MIVRLRRAIRLGQSVLVRCASARHHCRSWNIISELLQFTLLEVYIDIVALDALRSDAVGSHFGTSLLLFWNTVTWPRPCLRGLSSFWSNGFGRIGSDHEMLTWSATRVLHHGAR